MKQLSFTKSLLVAAAVVTGLASVVAPISASAAAKSSTPCVSREFRQGVYNDACVGYIQQMLNAVNSAKLSVDKDFGPKTHTAVYNWQKRMQQYKSIAADGIVGKDTWGTLCAERAEYGSLAKRAGCGKTSATTGSTPLRHCTERTFSASKNNRDGCVRHIHNMLNTARGVYLNPSAAYTSKTSKVVRDMQKQADLDVKRPGTVGTETWDLLCGHNMGNSYGQKIYNHYARQAGCEV